MTLKQAKKYTVGAILALYAVWILYVVLSGLAKQAVAFLAHEYLPGYWSTSWYLYIGSWISCALLGVSAYRCIRASLAIRSWKYITLSGVIGFAGYCIPMITFSIYAGRFHTALPYAFAPLCVALAGIACRHGETYIPIPGHFLKGK